MRNGQSPSRASRELHTKLGTIIRNTNAFKKVNGKWAVKKYDKISRIITIYKNGKQEWIEINDSRIASKIGKYNSAVNEFYRKGDKTVLKEFKKPFKDASGKLHHFEADPNKFYEIAEAQEESEFYEIYKI
ncbi:MAG: hypothetical protein QXW80_06245 [Candidatus Micrarchaeia archaeon]